MSCCWNWAVKILIKTEEKYKDCVCSTVFFEIPGLLPFLQRRTYHVTWPAASDLGKYFWFGMFGPHLIVLRCCSSMLCSGFALSGAQDGTGAGRV